MSSVLLVRCTMCSNRSYERDITTSAQDNVMPRSLVCLLGPFIMLANHAAGTESVMRCSLAPDEPVQTLRSAPGCAFF